MIKRSIPKKLIPVENLTEDLTVGAGGIDVTSPPTKQNTVYNMENLNVDLDGGVSLRRPLLYQNGYEPLNKVKLHYMYNDELLRIYAYDLEVVFQENDSIVNLNTSNGKFYNILDDTDIIDSRDVEWVSTLVINNTFLDIMTEFGDKVGKNSMLIDDVQNIKCINTNTSTLILGIKFNLNDPVLQKYSKNYNLQGSDNIKYRPIRIINDEGEYKATVLMVENPELYTEQNADGSYTSRMYFNLNNDYIYSLSDNYNANYVYSYGITAYTPKDPNLSLETVKNMTVEDLTESDKFKIVDSVTSLDEYPIIILKSFISKPKNTVNSLDVYCSWEFTYDNVNWNFLDEFKDAYPNGIFMYVQDSTKSYEKLTESYVYKRAMYAVKFNASSNLDLLSTRPDVLILNNSIQSGTYRFTLRSVSTSNVNVEIGKPTYTLLNMLNNIIYTDPNGDCTVNLKCEVIAYGILETSQINDLKLVFKTIFDNQTTHEGGEYDYHCSISGLDDASLNNIEYNWNADYDSLNNITVLTTTVEIPCKLYQHWLIQKVDLCIGFYNASSHTYFYEDLITFKICKKLDELEIQHNPNDLKRLVPLKTFAINPNGIITRYEYPFATAKRYWDNNYSATAGTDCQTNIDTVELSIDDFSHPLFNSEILINSTGVLPSTYNLFKFDMFEYGFENIEYRIPIYISAHFFLDWESFPGIWDTDNLITMGIQVFLKISLYSLIVLDWDILSNYILNEEVTVQVVNYSASWQRGESHKDRDNSIQNHARKLFSDIIKQHTAGLIFKNIKLPKQIPFVYSSSIDTFPIAEVSLESEYYEDINGNWELQETDEAVFFKNNDLNKTSYAIESSTDSNSQSYNYAIRQGIAWNTGIHKNIVFMDVTTPINPEYLYTSILNNANNVILQKDYYLNTSKELPVLEGVKPEYASLQLAAPRYNLLLTNIKQINNYEQISLNNCNYAYYNYRIWYYGKTLGNNLYFSNVDSYTTPLDNCLTLNTSENDYVTTLIPWRDYLIAATKNNIFLISKTGDSYTFKKINTFIGISEEDSNTCKAILNGIIFKSGTTVYTLHPNTYSSDETILNITDISKPISHHLLKGTNNFAIATEYEYYVFIPRDTDTLVFKYEYIRKIWSKFTYPVVLHTAKLFNVGDIVVTDINNNIYYFDKTLEWYKEKLSLDYLRYGDYLSSNIEIVKPITFMLDTGQKSSAMQYTKQFTESKFIIATMEMKDTFPIENTIYVDGVNLIASHRYISNELQLITTDPNTDGAFSRTNPEDIGYLNTNIINDNGETFNVIRQMILRYMGKGKTIRHVLKGESTFNFKIYVLYYRYRIPHNKQ